METSNNTKLIVGVALVSVITYGVAAAYSTVNDAVSGKNITPFHKKIYRKIAR